MREIVPARFPLFERHGSARKIFLDPAGRALDSAGFISIVSRAEQLSQDLLFLVGGHDGLPPEWRERADLLLSLSPMTFPHELARAMLLEQVYRAFTTLRGHPYPAITDCNKLLSVLLSLVGIQKHFGGVQALRSGNLNVAEGEVHLLMGENGAGKSTLMKVVAGLCKRDAGEMLWRGQSVSFAKPSEAAAQGIAMVHQESLLAPHLSVAENIYLGREERSFGGWIRRSKIAAQARRLIADNGFPLDADAQVGRLSPAGKQLVEICRAIAFGSSLLIFDEPTSSLSDAETRDVFRIVRSLRARNMGVVYITHRLEELRSIGDRVTILRDGSTIHSCRLNELSHDALIQQMVGRAVDRVTRRQSAVPGETLLKVRDLCRGMLQDINLEVKAGEIVGLAGLMGAGRTELCRVLFGLDAATAGTVEVAGRIVKPRSPRDAVESGVALIPEDRQTSGLVLQMPIANNISMPDLNRVSRFGLLQKKAESNLAIEFRDRLRIKCSSTQQRAGKLSGGNQQKIVIAKWMARGARVFLFDEPTRGIDVGAKQEVFEEMSRLARSGAAVLMVSSELPELLLMADRILVMACGRIRGELACPATAEAVMRLAGPPGATLAATA